jgi:hypothetical protein
LAFAVLGNVSTIAQDGPVRPSPGYILLNGRIAPGELELRVVPGMTNPIDRPHRRSPPIKAESRGKCVFASDESRGASNQFLRSEIDDLHSVAWRLYGGWIARLPAVPRIG